MPISGRIRLQPTSDSALSRCVRNQSIALTHREKSAAHVRIQLLEMSLNEGHHDDSKERPAGHPLKVVPASVEVWPVQLSAREGTHDPREGLFVAHVHPDGDMGSTAVTTKVPLADQESDEETLVEITRGGGMFHGKHTL
jgi:hypothetical protein